MERSLPLFNLLRSCGNCENYWVVFNSFRHSCENCENYWEKRAYLLSVCCQKKKPFRTKKTSETNVPPQNFVTSDCFTAPLFPHDQTKTEMPRTEKHQIVRKNCPPAKVLNFRLLRCPPVPQFTMLRRYGAIRPDQTKNRDAEHGEQTVRQTKMFPSTLNFRLLWRHSVPHLQC